MAMDTMTVDEKAMKAEALKGEGNAFVQSGEYRKALKCYHQAILYCSGLDRSIAYNSEYLTSSQKEKLEKLQVIIYSNMAMCLLKVEKYERAVSVCTKALGLSKTNEIKILYRRGLALQKLGKIDNAMKDVRAAMDLNPKDQAIRGTYKELHALQREEAKQEGAIFQGLFI
eukprot:Nk52_evm17s343 gene=Nk52_evmTU17s343